MIFQSPLSCADERSKVTHRVTRWVLQRLAIDRMSISATARALGVSWHLVNAIGSTAVETVVYCDTQHLEGIRVVGVDEHKWKHTHRTDQPSDVVTVLVDLTPIVDDTGPARLVDMRAGRSSAVLSTWLDKPPAITRDGVEVVTMDDFTGYATAVQQRLPDATTVMDHFYVVHLAAQKLTVCRQRIQQQTAGRRDRSLNPLYRDRKAPLSR